MSRKLDCHRQFAVPLALVLIVTLGAAQAGAAAPAGSPTARSAALSVWPELPDGPMSGTPLGPHHIPGGSTVGGLQPFSDTWGPGVITVTSDIVINPGVVIDILPDTTVQMATIDAANLGFDAGRVEYLVDGTLRAQGPVTFTSQANVPTCGDWVGIYFRPQSDGILHDTTVQYAVHAVEIDTTNPITIADSTLRHNCHRPLMLPPNDRAWGAGLAIYNGTHLITNTEIYDNIAEVMNPIPGPPVWAEGGGVQIVQPAGPTLFENCTIFKNHALNIINPLGDAAGGGVNVLFADPIFRNCEIYGNSVAAQQRAFGGGVNLDNSNGVIEGGSFIHDNMINSWNSNGWGGGISIGEALMPAPVVPIIRNSRVMTNQLLADVWGFGGGVGFYGGSWTMAVISGSVIAGNINLGSLAAQGGGIGMDGGATADLFDSNVIRDNIAQGANTEARGGGICLIAGNPVTVTNNLMLNNVADARVGGNVTGGGIFADGAAFILANNTIVSNTAHTQGQGGGVYFDDGLLLNSIIVGNTALADGGGVFWVAGTGSAGHNDVWNNWPNEYAVGGLPAPPIDLIPPADPLFAGGASAVMRYHLSPSSPCIDMGIGPGIGIPTHDFDGDPRPIGLAHDMGFDEVRLRVYLPLVIAE
jgi:hypothetical protein